MGECNSARPALRHSRRARKALFKYNANYGKVKEVKRYTGQKIKGNASPEDMLKWVKKAGKKFKESLSDAAEKCLKENLNTTSCLKTFREKRRQGSPAINALRLFN